MEFYLVLDLQSCIYIVTQVRLNRQAIDPLWSHLIDVPNHVSFAEPHKHVQNIEFAYMSFEYLSDYAIPAIITFL